MFIDNYQSKYPMIYNNIELLKKGNFFRHTVGRLSVALKNNDTFAREF